MESISPIKPRANRLLRSRKKAPPLQCNSRPQYNFSAKGSPPTLFNKLPTELLIIVIAPLSLSSIASLALTNRRMLCTIEEYFHPFALLRLPGNESERATFLQHFEAQRPDDYICHACGTFHPRSELKRGSPISSKTKVPTAYICPKHRETFPEKLSLCGWNIHWLTFYKTMRAYRYTGDYGNPFNLNLFKPEERGWSHETAVVPVDGHLLIRYRYSRGFETPTDMLDFRDHINELCPHVRRMGLDAEKFDQELQSAAEYITNLPLSDLVAGYTHDLHRCPNCPTEVMIQVHAASLYPGRTSKAARALPYIISVTRYIDVGECRAPNEVEWRAVTTRLDQMDGYKGHRRRSWWMGDTSSQTDVNACEEWSRHCFESREPIYLRFRKQVA